MNNSKHFTSVRENNEGVDDNKCENYFMTISNVSSNMNKSFKLRNKNDILIRSKNNSNDVIYVFTLNNIFFLTLY